MSEFGKERPFGRCVLGLRSQRELTQAVLSKRSGLSEDTIRRLEGGSFSPSLDTLNKICDGFRIRLSTLFLLYEHSLRSLPERELVDLFLSRPADVRVKVLPILVNLFSILDHQRAAALEDQRSSDPPELTPAKPRRPSAALERAMKLRSLADKIEQQGQRSLNTKRPESTRKRATEAAQARQEARRQIARAAVIRRVAEAVEAGEPRYISRVRARVHVELIDSVLRQGMWARLRELGGALDDDRTPERADVEWASFPHPQVEPAQVLALTDATATIPEVSAQHHAVSALRTRKAPFKLEDPEQFAAVSKLLRAVRKASKKLPVSLTPLASAVRDVERLRHLKITNTAELREALDEYLECCGDALVIKVESPLEARRRELRFAKIPGYFPTPRPLAERLVRHANIEAGMRVLEPSAGTGELAAVVREQHPEAVLELVEYQNAMRELLRDEGFEVVGEDFVHFTPSAPYDRVIMNPPFERRQDIEHIAKALSVLVPGGRLVAIAAGGFAQRKDAATATLRDALGELGAQILDLPNGSFRESGTNAGAVMIIVDTALHV